MSLRALLRRLTRRRLDLDEEDFQNEIRAHLAIAAAERIADGADQKSARQASLKEFGNVALMTDAARSVWRPRWLDMLRDLRNDIRYAIRALAKNPAFSLTVIGVLTLGIGLNAAVFTMLKSLALNPLAGVDGSAWLTVMYRETGAGRRVRVSYPDYQDLRDHARSFSQLFGSAFVEVNLGRGRGARQVSAELVTGNYFQVLGVGAGRGRTILPADEIAPGQHPVVVLSDGLWRRDFNADPDIVGRTVEINNYPLTVVGIADASFHGTIVSYDVEVFVPIMMAAQMGVGGGNPNVLADRAVGILFPHGYLRPGTSLAEATAEADALWATITADRPPAPIAYRLRLVPFRQSPTGGQTYALPAIVVLSAMGLLVLMIACANIAGLVLVRGVARRGEIALRLALGATRTRIVRLLIAENLVLALPGAFFGVVLALRGIPVLIGYAEWLAAPQRIFLNIGVDRLVIGFSVVIACTSALVFGFIPALQSSRVNLLSVMKLDLAPSGGARGRLRAALVVAQVAVSLLLLVASGLVTRSLEAARAADPGFEASHATAVEIDVSQNGYDESRGRVFYRQLLDKARADAGVESATLAAYVPMGFLDTRAQRVSLDGYEPRQGEDLTFLNNVVGSDYFRTLRINVLAGRPFEDHDNETAAPVAIVNRTLAERFWGSAANAIGKRLRAGDGDWRTVVGVAADVKYSRIDETPRPYFYLPFFQSYRSTMILHTRGSAPVERLVDQARANVAALDGDLPLLSARSLAERIMGALIFLDFTSTMLFVFGVAGMALAAMGTYGLVSYTVKQRTHEIGIRMALGAASLSVVCGFLRRGLTLGAIGAAIGIITALGLSTLVGSVLFGVSATDTIAFARALVIVLGGVSVATLVPAWRASRTDPLRALRHQ